MKTNYQRNFTAKNHSHYAQIQRIWRGLTMAIVEVGEPKGIYAKYPGMDHANGHRGTARAIAGAKKFVRSRLRSNENNNLRTIVREL